MGMGGSVLEGQGAVESANDCSVTYGRMRPEEEGRDPAVIN